MEKLRKFNIGVCEGRHEMPQVTDGFVFGQEVNPLDVSALEEQAEAFIEKFTWYDSVPAAFYHIKGRRYNKNKRDDEVKELFLGCEMVIYVTGLTVALMAIVKVACKYFVKVTLMHYDRNSNDYYPQVVQDFTAREQ